jgi:tetratricopeptide (TPR) repeat protein
MTEKTPQAATSRRDDALARPEEFGDDQPHDLDAWLESGLALCQVGQFSEGEITFRRILEIAPRHFDTLHFLGMVCSQQGKHAEALCHIDAALQIDPGAAAAHSSRGNVLAALKRFDEALGSFERAIALDPESPMIFTNRGNAQSELGQPEEAMASYDRAIALDPADAEAHYGRGNALQALGRSEEALASYDQAIAIRPDYSEAFNNRGVVLHELKRFDEAVASCKKALAIRPAFPEAFNNCGNAYRELFLLEEALLNYDSALALRAAFPEAWNNRGKVLQQLDRLEEALENYNKAIALRPDYPDALTCLGNVLQDLNFQEEPNTPHEALSTGLRHLRAGEVREAEELCRAILAADPNHAETHDVLGSALAAKGEIGEARTRFEQAIALAPTLADAHYHLGKLLDELGLAAEATTCYHRAVVLKPDFPAALRARERTTAFFRDPDVFACLTDRIRLQLNATISAGTNAVRIWVPACSTGQEVYSLAIVVRELLSEMRATPDVELIGTDISIHALQRARTGRYRGKPPASISAERLRRFFVSTDVGYLVCDSIREMCRFYHHDLAGDPPIADADIISCRNVLTTFFGLKLQARILASLQGALKPSGSLVLGKREVLTVPDVLFRPVDRELMIFTKN